MEQGWIFIGTLINLGHTHVAMTHVVPGMAIRMVRSAPTTCPRLCILTNVQAFDLGMNCDSTDWRINGQDLFTREELQTRRQIWWSCYLVDRYVMWVMIIYEADNVEDMLRSIWVWKMKLTCNVFSDN